MDTRYKTELPTTWNNNSSQCNGTGGLPPSVYWSISFSGTVSIVVVLLLFLGLFSNGSVFFLLAINKSLRTTPAFLLSNVALAELTFFVLVVPISLSAVANGGMWSGAVLCQVNGFLTVACASAIWQGHAVIAAERYAKVVHPLRRIFTRKFSVSLVTMTWAISIGIALIPFFSSQGYFVVKARVMCAPDFSDYKSPFLVLFFMALFLPLIIMVMCQLAVYRIARQVQHHKRRSTSGIYFVKGKEELTTKTSLTGSLHSDSPLHSSERDSYSQTLKDDIYLTFASFQSSVLYFIIFVLGMIVEIIFHQVQPIHPMSCNLESSPAFYASVVHFLLVVADLAINPFVYIRRNRAMHAEMIERLTRTCCCSPATGDHDAKA